jgi:hypothetical protein
MSRKRRRPSREDARLDRQHLLEGNLAQVEAAYTLGAVTHGPDAVVIVADARYTFGEAMSRHFHGEDGHRALLARMRAQRKTPTLILSEPRQTAVETIGWSSPHAAEILGEAPPPGYFRVVVVDGTGNLFVALPIPR